MLICEGKKKSFQIIREDYATMEKAQKTLSMATEYTFAQEETQIQEKQQTKKMHKNQNFRTETESPDEINDELGEEKGECRNREKKLIN